MLTQAISECIDYIDTLLGKLYDEHVDQFTYMMETPYNYHYWVNSASLCFITNVKSC